MNDIMNDIRLMSATVQLVVTFVFTLLFRQEWKKQKRSENEQYIPYALMLLYFFLFLGTVLMIYSYFFADATLLEILMRTRIYFLIAMGFIVIVSGILIYIAERIVRKDTKHYFLIYFICIVTTITILKPLNLLFTGFNLILLIPLLVLIVLFLHKLIWKTSGELRKKMLIVILGFGLFLMVISQEIWLTLQQDFDILYNVKGLLVLASVLTGFGFYTIPSFTEFDWNEKIRHLYILNPSGICLFEHAFREKSLTDKDLFGGSLIAIQSLMKEMIKSEKSLQVIDHGDAKILFEQSPHAIGIMVADEDLYIVHFKLQKLLKEFEQLFGLLMKDWKGNLDLFYPLGPIINRIFEVKD